MKALFTPAKVEELAAVGQALSDPIRVEMLAMMAAGRERCSLPGDLVPNAGDSSGLCVCEFEEYFGMAQSKVSYHIKKLKDAGLVSEERRGRWNYYSINHETLAGVADELKTLGGREG